MPENVLDIERLRGETFVARVEHHPTLGSTNDRARQCAAEGSGRLPLLVVADRQTAGRGRGKRRWWTGPGSLAFSLLLAPEQAGGTGRTPSPLVALATAVAVVETVAPRMTPHRPGIKWPNDVMAAGGKLAGILVEVLPDGKHILGVGINTNNRPGEVPPELRKTVRTLRELTGTTHDHTQILVGLLNRLKAALEELATTPERIADRASAWCVQCGEPLLLRSGGQTISGRCAGIALDGSLLLDTPEGRRTVSSGTVLGQ